MDTDTRSTLGRDGVELTSEAQVKVPETNASAVRAMMEMQHRAERQQVQLQAELSQVLAASLPSKGQGPAAVVHQTPSGNDAQCGRPALH